MSHTMAEAAHLNHPDTQRAFGKVRTLTVAYGAIGAAVLVTVVVLASTGHTMTGFVWSRAAGLFASAAVTYWMTALASKGRRWAYLRLRIISIAVPVALIAMDMIPGILPVWFVVMQAGAALVIAAAAFVVNGSRLRAAFPESR
ncbi:hypothetical protein [Microbispora sp. NPDC049125]|uniref:hypothetical protein n=1 Tax=Microbispora sp. NPDC049125 TaxID=3154929 RepID=UPI0034670CEB